MFLIFRILAQQLTNIFILEIIVHIVIVCTDYQIRSVSDLPTSQSLICVGRDQQSVSF